MHWTVPGGSWEQDLGPPSMAIACEACPFYYEDGLLAITWCHGIPPLLVIVTLVELPC